MSIASNTSTSNSLLSWHFVRITTKKKKLSTGNHNEINILHSHHLSQSEKRITLYWCVTWSGVHKNQLSLGVYKWIEAMEEQNVKRTTNTRKRKRDSSSWKWKRKKRSKRKLGKKLKDDSISYSTRTKKKITVICIEKRKKWTSDAFGLCAYVRELSQVRLSWWKAIYVPNEIKLHIYIYLVKFQNYKTIGVVVCTTAQAYTVCWFSRWDIKKDSFCFWCKGTNIKNIYI